MVFRYAVFSMIENYRHFTVGPDPFGRTWEVRFQWLQNGISIRHADTVDVKFRMIAGDRSEEKVIALPHPELLALSKEAGRLPTDAWCMKLAALHLRHMILTDEDTEKTVITPSREELRAHHDELGQQTTTVK